MNIIFPLETNMRGQAVQDLQNALRQIGIQHQGAPGLYDSQTFSVVEQFQRQLIFCGVGRALHDSCNQPTLISSPSIKLMG